METHEGCLAAGNLFKFPACQVGGITGALVIGGLAAAGATAYAASQSSDAQKSAAQAAATSQMNANQLNYQQFQESRGLNGSAVLPTYLRNPNGSLFEGSLGSDLVGAYNGSNTPLSTFQGATSTLQPAQNNANRLTNDIFNGGITKTMLNNAAPVQQSRLAVARSSSLDALHKTLDQIDATQAGRGYVGDSYSNRLLSFQAGQQAGNAIGAADLQNKQETADISNYGNITLPMNNVTLPYTMAQQNNQMAFLPQAEWLQSINQRMAPFNMIKLGVGAPFQYQPIPTPGPGAYSGAANAAAGIAGIGGQLSSAALQYYQQKQLQQNLLQQQQAQTQSAQVMNDYLNGNPNQTYSTGAPLAGYVAANGASGASPSAVGAIPASSNEAAAASFWGGP